MNTISSLSINHSFSPFLPATSSSSPSTSTSLSVVHFPSSSSLCNSTIKLKPIPYLISRELRSSKGKKFILKMSITESLLEEGRAGAGPNDNDNDDEVIPPVVDCTEGNKPRRIALFVEPSPFAYVSGYKNRFQNFIKYLREMGDEVLVVTTKDGVPEEFHGAKLIGSKSFPCPWYNKVPLSLALSPRIISEVANFKPDIIHASSPGIMVFGALIIAKLLSVPIVMSYHTHVPIYIPRYTFSWLVTPMWMVIKFLHRSADLTLVPSAQISRDLQAAHVTTANRIRLWNKGVDSDSFHPRFRNHETRCLLSNGEPEKPLIIHVGRLGVEKSLDFCKQVMDRIPEARIAFIGDGPYRAELESIFTGMPAVFTGMLSGEELSKAYASGDVFLMPSESETLGLVVLESMSSGVPVVGVRAGGIPDIITADQEGKTGYLYTPGDLEDCLNKLIPLLRDSELRERIGKAAREDMEQYDWRAATKKIRNEQYNAAIWFWRRKKAELLRPFQWCFKKIFGPKDEVTYVK
ncbi:hypothetical protein MKW92_023716 [Papaver armeniacum]|nr:hypothetical protein MKW92_023716 [Papaver armeniacum]